MKIDWNDKKTKVFVIIFAVIILPILFNKIKGCIIGSYTSYTMGLPKEVEIAKPEARLIQPILGETTGRVEAKISVDLIARVDGWLTKKYFEEGDIVKRGQKLFLIQPEEYALAVKNASASVSEARAVYKNAVIDYNRAKSLLKEDLVSREYYDNALMNKNRSRAALDGAISQLSKASLDLSYTNITAPMDGRIGQVNITEGNYVTANTGTIAQIYSTNPMKIIFPLKSSEFIKLKKLYQQRKEVAVQNPVSILLKLSDKSMYDYEGQVSFVDNKIDESTGTVTVKALFENPNEILVPGDYVNVIIRQNIKEEVMLIPQSATKTNIGTGYYVWIVQNGKAVKKDIKVNYNIDNNWVVEDGLSYNDDVIVKGIQDIFKSGQKVKIIEPKSDNKISVKPTNKNHISYRHKIKNVFKRILKKLNAYK